MSESLPRQLPSLAAERRPMVARGGGFAQPLEKRANDISYLALRAGLGAT
jgi:hypothetical protein